MSNITKQGIIKTNNFNESLGSKYDYNIYVEPDNSAWIRIFHHNNPASKLFASTDTFASSVYLDVDRWFNISILNYITNNTYELMIKQATTSGGTETKYRWIQTVNPMTAAFGDVDAADVTKITTTGYSTASNYGGLYYSNSNTYLRANNSKSSNWYGATGSWTLTSNKLPAYGGVTISTGYMDLYIRIDNQPNKLTSIFDAHIQANEFIEW